MPCRHQRSRAKGSRLPDGVVCVTRPGKYGNPFETAAEFRSTLACAMQGGLKMKDSRVLDHMNAIAENLEQLRGKDLACWCPLGADCHADVLIEFANRS